jgi:hypothetical protein
MSFVLDSLSGFYDKGRPNKFQINADLKTPQTMYCQDFQRIFIKNNATLVSWHHKIKNPAKAVLPFYSPGGCLMILEDNEDTRRRLSGKGKYIKAKKVPTDIQ